MTAIMALFIYVFQKDDDPQCWLEGQASWKMTSWKMIKAMMSSAGCRLLGWGRPSASVEDVVKSFKLIVMPGLRDNKLAGRKGCIVFVTVTPSLCCCYCERL